MDAVGRGKHPHLGLVRFGGGITQHLLGYSWTELSFIYRQLNLPLDNSSQQPGEIPGCTFSYSFWELENRFCTETITFSVVKGGRCFAQCNTGSKWQNGLTLSPTCHGLCLHDACALTSPCTPQSPATAQG